MDIHYHKPSTALARVRQLQGYHIHSQVQFQERNNLPKCQCGFQNLEFGQVQMGVLKWNLVFQNNMILWLAEWLAISEMVKR